MSGDMLEALIKNGFSFLSLIHDYVDDACILRHDAYLFMDIV